MNGWTSTHTLTLAALAVLIVAGYYLVIRPQQVRKECAQDTMNWSMRDGARIEEVQYKDCLRRHGVKE